MLATFFKNAKSIPKALKLLAAINLTLFIGVVIREQCLFYLIGSFIFITLLITAFGNYTKLIVIPQSLTSQNVYYQISCLINDICSSMIKLELSKNMKGDTKFLVNALLIIYFLNIIGPNIALILLVNAGYFSIFLPLQFEGIIGLLSELRNIVPAPHISN